MIKSTERTTIDEYHDRPELSSSQIAAYLDDPIKFYHQHVAKDWPKDTPTPAMQFGTNVHTMIERGGFESICKTVPKSVLNKDGHRKGKAYTDWKAENPSEDYVNEGQPNPYQLIWESLQANDFTRQWINEPDDHKEVDIYWTHPGTGLKCRSRIDYLRHNAIIDWKTATDVGPRDFQQDVCYRNYDIRLAFYQQAVEEQFGQTLPVIAVAIQNKPGYSVVPYEIPQEWLDEARSHLQRILERIRDFQLADYANKSIITLSKPRWRFSDRYELQEA